MEVRDDEAANKPSTPKLVATTGSTFNCTVGQSIQATADSQNERKLSLESWPSTKLNENNYFKVARW